MRLLVLSLVFFCLTAGAQARVENGDTIVFGRGIAPVQLDISSLMRLYHAPGLSVAVVDDFKIVWAQGYGVMAAGGHVPVTPETLFQAGSISKPVAAVATLALVQNGTLNLDENVNVALRTWHVPDNAFTATQKVTLRRILSHTAGLTVHGFDGYARGGPVPTLEQILDGLPPATNAPVRVTVAPGTVWRYSGGGAEVEQLLDSDVTGKPFPQLANELVFEKAGMHHSTYEQPLPPERAAAAASGTYYDGMPVTGGWQVLPQLAAAGLWTTPTDLANLAIEIALSKQGRSNRVLDRRTATMMLTPQVDKVGEVALGNQTHPDRMGLGFFLGDASRPDLFGHIGDDPGFQAMLEMYASSGKGVAIMGNSQNAIVLGDYLIERIAREYGWPGYVLPDRYKIGVGDALALVALRDGIRVSLDAYRALKQDPTLNGPRYPLTQNALIHLAYAMQARGRHDDALAAALFETQEYPKYWNAFDTLGDMYVDLGQKQNAIAAYRQSLKLNPEAQSSKDALTRLGASITSPS